MEVYPVSPEALEEAHLAVAHVSIPTRYGETDRQLLHPMVEKEILLEENQSIGWAWKSSELEERPVPVMYEGLSTRRNDGVCSFGEWRQDREEWAPVVRLIQGARKLVTNTFAEPLGVNCVGATIIPIRTRLSPSSHTAQPAIPQYVQEAFCHLTQHLKGEEEAYKQLNALLGRYEAVFRAAVGPTPAKVTPMDIELTTRTPVSLRLRRMGPRPQDSAKQQLQTLLELGVIRRSTSAYQAPLVMVKKRGADDEFRLCVDYTALNEVTVPMGGFLPIIEQMIPIVAGAAYFGKIDLTQGYHQCPMEKGSEKYTAIVTPWGLYEFLRVPFGLRNAPMYFQAMMREVLGELIEEVCLVYIDDVIIFGKTWEKYLAATEAVLTKLRKHQLIIKPGKCEFAKTSIEFLGMKLNGEGMRMTANRKAAIEQWPTPTSHKAMQRFLGFIQYIRAFVPRLSELTAPLHRWVSGKSRNWSETLQAQFERVRDAVATNLTLHHIDYKLPLTLRTDASIEGVGGVLFQTKEGTEQYIAFMSAAFNDAQRRWSTIEQETYAVLAAILRFHHLLEGTTFTVETDHRNIQFLKKQANAKLTRWMLQLQNYSFNIRHIPGKENVAADALSRCYYIKRGNKDEGEMARTLHGVHNQVVGHHGVNATYALARLRDPEFRGTRKDVQEFVQSCPFCQKSRLAMFSQNTIGRSTSAAEPFQAYGMDFVGPLPKDSNNMSYILVVIDMFSRYVELFPTQSVKAEEVVRRMMELMGRYGLPESVHSDRGTHFAAKMVQELMSYLKINQEFSLPYRPQTNGMVERTNAEVMRHLRALIQPQGRGYKDWSMVLPLVQRILNTTPHSATGIPPHMLMFPSSLGLDRGILFPFSNNDQISDLPEFLKEMKDKQAELLEMSSRHLTEVTAEADKKAKEKPPRQFHEGQYVLRRSPTGRRTKLDHKVWGPFLVKGQEGATVRLEDLNNQAAVEVHVDDLVPFLRNPNWKTTPQQEAAKDRQEWVVVAVKSSRKEAGKMKFLVQWEPTEDMVWEDTWEPVENLRHVEAFHQYVLEKAPQYYHMLPPYVKELNPDTAREEKGRRRAEVGTPAPLAQEVLTALGTPDTAEEDSDVRSQAWVEDEIAGDVQLAEATEEHGPMTSLPSVEATAIEEVYAAEDTDSDRESLAGAVGQQTRSRRKLESIVLRERTRGGKRARRQKKREALQAPAPGAT